MCKRAWGATNWTARTSLATTFFEASSVRRARWASTAITTRCGRTCGSQPIRRSRKRSILTRRRKATSAAWRGNQISRSEEHTSELQSHHDLVCRLLLEKKKKKKKRK